ncbi:MAG TPA: TRAP transporter substrate-binding protein [Stellaceae bacterium]|nr:TRAP transporter substrate-binding protein [Stellaceae bacterium]
MKTLGLAVAAAVLAMTANAWAADQPVHLRMSSWVPPKHPLNPAFEAWAKDIEQASGGSITATLFTSEQLGKAVDHYDMARDGIADLAYVNPGYQPGRFPIIAAGELPFLMENADGGTAALDAWYRKYAAQEMKDVHFCFAFVHDPGTFHSHKKILVPADINGMKIRPANATIGNLVTLLGGTNVQASAPEVRDVLERHVADAVTFPWGSVILFGLDKVVHEHMDVPLYVTTFVWVMNKAKYAAMSPAQKAVIDAHCTTEWAVKVASPWTAFEASGRDKLRREPGHDVYKISADQLAQWRKAVEPLTAQWAEGARKAGIDPDKALAELKEELARRKAAY